MRLHRSISSDLPLLVVALEEEATHLHGSELPVLVTGAGKVNAAVAVATILGEFSPARVINLGTAGSLRDGLWGTQVISRVTQHDLDDSALFALTGLHFGAPIEFGGTGPTLTTGDDFVSDATTRNRLAQQADLVDMEGYAIAHAAAVAGVPLTIVKQVSDQAGATAGKSWSESVDECSAQLGAWVRANVLK
ncbi:MAG: nucleosidase [Actinobacteria bacterium]|nr:nucleosidase [Actinomycetota bacterium]